MDLRRLHKKYDTDFEDFQEKLRNEYGMKANEINLLLQSFDRTERLRHEGKASKAEA